MPMTLPALCEALSAAGIRIFVDKRGRCFPTNPSAVTPAMFESLKWWKLELLQALRLPRAPRDIRPLACSRCESTIVLEAGELCRPCNRLKGRRVEYQPGSTEEREYLKAFENSRANPVQLSPTVPTPKVGTVHASTVPNRQVVNA